MNEQKISISSLPDVSPRDDYTGEEPKQPLPGYPPTVVPGSTAKAVPDADGPGPKKWYDKAIGIFKADPDVKAMRAEQDLIQEDAARKHEELEHRIAKRESDLYTKSRDRDPGVKAARKHQMKVYRARLAEAKLLTALTRMATEYIRRHAIKDSEPDVAYYMNMLDNKGLMGSIFSLPPSKRKE